MKSLLMATQIAVALSILNVWARRRELASPWRGGAARNLREEFTVYGLPGWAMTAVGVAKVTCALLLLAGLVFPELVKPAAALTAVFMLGAIAMHVKVGDPLRKSLPAACLLVLALAAAILPAA